MGIYSLASTTPIKQTGFVDADTVFEEKSHYSDWRFLYQPSSETSEPAHEGMSMIR
ncbi:hypothetical protein CCP3SC15_930022 [Gammaproteobacteria bacterium]